MTPISIGFQTRKGCGGKTRSTTWPKNDAPPCAHKNAVKSVCLVVKMVSISLFGWKTDLTPLL
jgi:hypothetical protein